MATFSLSSISPCLFSWVVIPGCPAFSFPVSIYSLLFIFLLLGCGAGAALSTPTCLSLFLSFLSILIFLSSVSSLICSSLSSSLHLSRSFSPNFVTSLGMAQRLYSLFKFIRCWPLMSWMRTDSIICLSNDVLACLKILTPNLTSSLLSPSCISTTCLSMWLFVFSCLMSLRCSEVLSKVLLADSPT